VSADTLVLGAGPAGLAFAHRYGPGAIVLEKTRDVGGLSRSIEIDDGVFDIGGHSFHTPHAEVLALVRSLMKGALHEQPRDARVWVNGELIPYPFQRHFDLLHDARIVAECRGHVVDAKAVAQSADFEEWIARRFGEGVAKNFMLPYNRKLWACDLHELSCDWVVERVATDAATERGASDAAKPARRPLAEESRVAYPAQGGFGAIFVALADRCERIELGQEVVQIDPANRTARTAEGRVWPWDRIVSTIPLPLLLAAIEDCPRDLIELASRLRAVSLKILLILASLRDTSVPQRIYVANPGIAPHKIAFNHTSSPSLSTRPHHAIMCEVSYSPDKPAKPDDELLRETVEWLVANRFVDSPADVVAQRVIDVRYGYPAPTHAKAAIVAEIAGALERYGIHTIGRFGGWHYANSDECMRQGLELGDRLRSRAA
jgi:protoporphyrinogen oxidase